MVIIYDHWLMSRPLGETLPGLDGVSAAQSATSETMEQKLKELKDGS